MISVLNNTNNRAFHIDITFRTFRIVLLDKDFKMIVIEKRSSLIFLIVVLIRLTTNHPDCPNP